VVTLLTLAWMTVSASPAATITVNSTADSGPGTLREALTTAGSGDTIVFDVGVFPPGAPATIALTSALPDITQGNLTIDGTGAGVILDGSGTPTDTVGISITSNGNTVKGLQILSFPDAGVVISGGAKSNSIGGDTPEERNVVSGNGGSGVLIKGSGTDANTVSGNFIGTDATGTAALGNLLGVYIYDGAKNNTIGGTAAGERNVISGNDFHGVAIYAVPNPGTDANTVSGNYIGTDVSGTAALGNGSNGVKVAHGAKNNVIGGDTPGERNLISGNAENGVLISDEDTKNNIVSGNYVGTDVNGTAALANGEHGVVIDGSAQSNTVGGLSAGEGNLIGGNTNDGVRIDGFGAEGNVVIGNHIGLDSSGSAALGNGEHGVEIVNGAARNTIGGLTEGERNVVSANARCGIVVGDPGGDENVVSGNYIGTDASGTVGLGNGRAGVAVWFGAQDNLIGGNTIGAGNLIAHNTEAGVLVEGSGSTGNTISHNSITANSGMGIENRDGGSCTISNSQIVSNTSGAISNSGIVTVTHSIVEDHSGAEWAVWSDNHLVMDGCTIRDNGTFGIVHIKTGHAEIRNTKIVDNDTAAVNGDIIGIGDEPTTTPTVEMVNVLVAGNNSARPTVNGSSPIGSITLTNVSVADNAVADFPILAGNGNWTVANSIVWGNTTSGDMLGLGTFSVSYSDIEGGWTGSGNIDADPRFVDATSGDYHLGVGSPCIDQGTTVGAPTHDIEGTPREAAPDMGAYEWTGFRVFLPVTQRSFAP
jgi:titin